MKIAVIAGTRFDTALGCSLLEQAGMVCHPVPMAETPGEQNLRQYTDAGGLQKKMENVVMRLHHRGFKTAMIFCNSLTTSLDMERLKKQTPLHIVSPLDVYARIAQKWKSIFIIAANGHTVASIEAFMLARNPAMKVAGFSGLGFVTCIENAPDPRTAFHSFPFSALLETARQLDSQAILLGCTHLSHILPQITAHTDLPVLDTGTVMTRLVRTSSGQGSLIPPSGLQNC